MLTEGHSGTVIFFVFLGSFDISMSFQEIMIIPPRSYSHIIMPDNIFFKTIYIMGMSD